MGYQGQRREEIVGKSPKELRVSETNMDAAHPSARWAPRPEKAIDPRRDLDTTLHQFRSLHVGTDVKKL